MCDFILLTFRNVIEIIVTCIIFTPDEYYL